MKVYMMVILFVFGLEMGISQTDGFFILRDECRHIEKDVGYSIVSLPDRHGLYDDYYADSAPLESGCLLLLGLGLAYAKFKNKDEA